MGSLTAIANIYANMTEELYNIEYLEYYIAKPKNDAHLYVINPITINLFLLSFLQQAVRLLIDVCTCV